MGLGLTAWDNLVYPLAMGQKRPNQAFLLLHNEGEDDED